MRRMAFVGPQRNWDFQLAASRACPGRQLVALSIQALSLHCVHRPDLRPSRQPKPDVAVDLVATDDVRMS